MSDTDLETARLSLPANLDIAFAGPLADHFQALRGRDLIVEAAGVRRVGAQCLQIIVSASATWKADALRLRIDAPSNEFLSTVSLLGVDLGAASWSGTAL